MKQAVTLDHISAGRAILGLGGAWFEYEHVAHSEAQRVWRRQMEHNHTAMADVEDDDTFWVGTPEHVAEQLPAVCELAFNTAIAELAAPYDDETLQRFLGQVKPLVDRG